MERKVIGIDFGSSQSSISIMEIGTNRPPELLNVGGGRNGVTIPTRLALDPGDNSVIAYGNKVGDHYKEKNGTVKFVSNFKRYLGASPTQITDKEGRDAEMYSRLFLKEMANFVKNHYNIKHLDPEDYVTCIAHPATWNEQQVALLKKITEEAGFPVDPEKGIYTVEEPVAAMHSLKVHEELNFKFGNKPENYMVIDYGGGTLDICIIKTDILGRTPKVIATSGDPMLGGKEFDEIIESFFFRNNDSIKKDELAPWELAELRDKFKEAKETFSENFKNNSESTYVFHFSRGQYNLTVSKTEFESICKDRGIFEKIKTSIHDALGKAHIAVNDIRKVILTGGSSKWYFVRKIAAEVFFLGGEQIFLTKQPFTDVASGCAIKIGRPDSPPEKKGIWIKFKANNSSWSAPKCILPPRRNTASKTSEELMFIDTIRQTRYLKPHRVYLSWWTGYEEDKLTKVGDNAIIEFYARSNLPFLGRLHGAWKGIKGLENKPVKDEYKFYLQYHEDSEDMVIYRFKIMDASASAKEARRILEGENAAAALPDGKTQTGEILPGFISYRGLIGLRTRKLMSINSTKEN